MPQSRIPWRGASAWVVAWLVLMGLPLLPELALQVQNRTDLKSVIPILYYQGIVSFVLLAPVAVLPRLAARIWGVAGAVLMALPTLVVGFYSASSGARWNIGAHAAMLQTDAGEAGGFLRGVTSFGILVWTVLLAVSFAGAAVVLTRSERPSRRTGWIFLGTGLLVGTYGISNAIRFGNDPIREVAVTGATPVRVFGFGINMLHPVTLLGATHFNYRQTHRYYLEQYRRSGELSARLRGAKPAPGAAPPRVLVVILGESATRRHLSLYGYERKTTPRLDALAGELHVFRDVVATTVGSLASIRSMLTMGDDATPIFAFFSGAGYTTHWISSKHDQGFEDLELPAFASASDRSVFLGGTYDENLLPLVAQAVAAPGPQAVFVHLMGSHVRYRDRYPSRFASFAGDGPAGRMRAEYDNSILYTDFIVAEIIELVRQQATSAGVLYLSDHGEDVFDSNPGQYLFRSDAIATDPMYEVPFVAWLSPGYVAASPDFASAVRTATARRYQTHGLYHSLLGLAQLTHPLHDPAQDVFAAGFRERERRVGTAGRIYPDSPPANP